MLEGGRAAGAGAAVSRSPGGDVDSCLHFFLNFFFFFKMCVRACGEIGGGRFTSIRDGAGWGDGVGAGCIYSGTKMQGWRLEIWGDLWLG